MISNYYPMIIDRLLYDETIVQESIMAGSIVRHYKLEGSSYS